MKQMTHIPKFRRFVIQNFPFIEEDFDALTDYALMSKIVEYLNNVIQSQNDVVDNVTELNQAFITLKDFVDHYFDNLDVQQEINNKLDQMVEDGTLQEIVADYLNSKAVFGYDTVADMKLATNLIDGSYAETLGYRTKNDGGSGLYKIREITNSDVVDEMTIIAIGSNDLIAELVSPEVYPETLGAYGDGTHDDYNAINKLLSLYTDSNKTIKFSSAKTYAIGTGISMVATRKVFLDFNGCILKALVDMQMFKFRNYSLRNEPNGYIKNLTLDCNAVATAGLVLDGSWRITYDTINILGIPVGGTGIKVGLTTSVHNGGNLLNNIRGTGVDNDDYTSNTEYNTFIEIISGSPDSTYSNIDYTNIKRGIVCGAFSTFNNVHGFVGGDYMYVESYFMKITGSALINNVYPDTQQFGIVVANNPVSINNIVFVFNSELVSAETLSNHPAYGVVSSSSAGGKTTNITGAILNTPSTVQKLYPSATVTENGTSYYKPTTISFNSISSNLSTVEYDTAIMQPFQRNTGITNLTITSKATPYDVSGVINFTTGVASSQDVATWSNVYSNYIVVPGLYPVIIESNDDTRVAYIRITDGYVMRVYGTISNGEKIHYHLPLVRKKALS